MGYVPVVNRGQRDIDTNKSIAAALEHERSFFENHPSYKSKAQYCGTPFLARKLNIVLMHHVCPVLHPIWLDDGALNVSISISSPDQIHITGYQSSHSTTIGQVHIRIAKSWWSFGRWELCS